MTSPCCKSSRQITHSPLSSVNMSSDSNMNAQSVLKAIVLLYDTSSQIYNNTTTHHPDHYPIFISIFHLPRYIASSLFKLCAWQSFCTTSFHVLFGLPLGLELSTSYSIHFFSQSVSSFRSTRPYHRNLFCCSSNII